MLQTALETTGASVVAVHDDALEVTGRSQESVGVIAAEQRIALTELTARRHTLEDLFFSLTEHHDDHRS